MWSNRKQKLWKPEHWASTSHFSQIYASKICSQLVKLKSQYILFVNQHGCQGCFLMENRRLLETFHPNKLQKLANSCLLPHVDTWAFKRHSCVQLFKHTGKMKDLKMSLHTNNSLAPDCQMRKSNYSGLSTFTFSQYCCHFFLQIITNTHNSDLHTLLIYLSIQSSVHPNKH